jgi:hypothetical protein
MTEKAEDREITTAAMANSAKSATVQATRAMIIKQSWKTRAYKILTPLT